ncbi:MAG: DUF2286 domain-containing protein [Sulfolobales archaeon]|nr:DUF2286 domain-containing protein [Sulfolobales archaeon]MDW8083290.1 DUF2286 domain-containing protein [Sulfolobales archaeon]
MSTVVAHIEFGELKMKRVVEAPVEETVRSILFEVLAIWDPAKSDLVVTREKLSNIKPELVKQKDIDIYVISYDIEWREDSVVDRRFFVVMKNIDEASAEAIEELATLSREELLEFKKEVKTL